jgi:hypothetical protein
MNFNQHNVLLDQHLPVAHAHYALQPATLSCLLFSGLNTVIFFRDLYAFICFGILLLSVVLNVY